MRFCFERRRDEVATTVFAPTLQRLFLPPLYEAASDLNSLAAERTGLLNLVE
jgi:hypothetical protein